MNVEQFLDLPDHTREMLITAHRVRKAIQQRWKDLSDEFTRVTEDIKELQNACTHPMATKTHHASTGNYDRSDDRYWTQFVCPDCRKVWTEEGSK